MFLGSMSAILGSVIGGALGGGALAAGFGTIAGMAIVGAGVGALTSLVLGGDIGEGALWGAVGGAVMGGFSVITNGAVSTAVQAGSGFMESGGISGAARAGKVAFDALSGGGGLLGLGGGGSGGGSGGGAGLSGGFSQGVGVALPMALSGTAEGIMKGDEIDEQNRLFQQKLESDEEQYYAGLDAAYNRAKLAAEATLGATEMKIEADKEMYQNERGDTLEDRASYSASVSGIAPSLLERQATVAGWSRPVWLKPVTKPQTPVAQTQDLQQSNRPTGIMGA